MNDEMLYLIIVGVLALAIIVWIVDNNKGIHADEQYHIFLSGSADRSRIAPSTRNPAYVYGRSHDVQQAISVDKTHRFPSVQRSNKH